jgi:hypothetical protein
LVKTDIPRIVWIACVRRWLRGRIHNSSR